MIKATDLRVGNLLADYTYSFSAKVVKVRSICSDGTIQIEPHGAIMHDLETMAGIPLSEEWLKGFGFEKIDSETFAHHKFKELQFFKHINLKSFGVVIKGSCQVPTCKEVHHLQNLFFALTGQELELKP